MNERKKKNILIGGLLAIVVVMGIAYAAFASNLNITGTANTTNNWGVRITSITPDKNAGGTSPNYTSAGSITQSYTDLTATFEAALVSPGDSVTYTITVENYGDLDAKLDSITMPESSNPAISFSKANIKVGDVIKAGSNNTKTFTVTVSYVNTEGQGQPASTTSNFSLTLNFVQDDGITTPSAFSGTIYRNNTNNLLNNKPMNGDSTIYYPSDKYSSASEAFDDGGFYPSESECLNDGVSNCASGTVTLSPGTYYTAEQLSTVNSRTEAFGKQYYLKHDVDDDIVTASYVCFVTDTEHCMQGGGFDLTTGTSAYYATNKTLLQGQESWFTTVASPKGICSFDDFRSYCGGGGFNNVGAGSYGDVRAGVSVSDSCSVYINGSSYCSVSESGGGSGSGGEDHM